MFRPVRNRHKRPLEDDDSLLETSGCRHSNPDICKNAMTEGVCAFARADNRCTKPPRSWPRLYKILAASQN